MGRGGVAGGGFSRHRPHVRRDTLESKAVRRPRLNSTLKSLLFWMVLVVVGVLIWQFSVGLRPSPTTIPFSQFLQKVDAGDVATVVMTGSEITGTYNGNAGNGTDKFRTYAPAQYEGLANNLFEKGVGIDAKPESASPWTALLYSWAP